jgi:hypothetical protein
MAIILQDSFVGSAGDIDGRTPEVTYAALNWVSDVTEPLNLDGSGAAESADQSSVDMRGFGDVGVGGTTDYGMPTGVTTTITFVVKTGASVTLGALDHEGFRVAVEAGETYFSGGLYGPNTTDGRPWQVFEEADGDSNAVTTPAINTEYTGTYVIADGTQTLTFMGNTKSSAVAFTNPALGVNRIGVKVGAGFKLMSITAEDDRAETISVEATVPVPTAVIQTGVRIPSVMPVPRATITISQNISVLEVNVPAPVAAVRLGNRISATAPMPALNFSGTSTGMVRIAAAVPVPSADIRMTSTGTARITAVIPAPTAAVRGGARVVGAAPMPAANIRGTTGSVLSFTLVAPMPSADIQMSSGGIISLDINVPLPVSGPWGRITAVAPMARAEIVMRSVVVVTYEAYAVNLKHNPKRRVEPIDEVTRYTNYPFNQIVRYKNQYYGVASDGIYLIGGATDDGDPIPWAWKTALEDNDALEKKTVRSAYFSGRVGPEAEITVYAGESGQNAYTYTTPRDANPQNYRKVFGRGVKGRYYAIGVEGDTTLDLDGLDLEVDKLTRKI